MPTEFLSAKIKEQSGTCSAVTLYLRREGTRVTKRIAIAGGIAILVAVGWAASHGLSGWGFGSSDDGCTTMAGKGADGVLEGEARCTWPIPVERIDALLAAWGDQARYFSNVSESQVLEQDDQRMLVRQVYHASGISDREVVIECFTESIPGGRRYHWRKAVDQSRSSGRHVEVGLHEGFWQVTSGEHGTTVEYHMRYLPGGSVPSFLVSMFLSSGIHGVLDDLHRAAAGSQVAARSDSGA